MGGGGAIGEMKVPRAMLGVAAFMAAALLVFLFNISSPRVVKVEPEYTFSEEEDEKTSPPSQLPSSPVTLTSPLTPSSPQSSLPPSQSHVTSSTSSAPNTSTPSPITPSPDSPVSQIPLYNSEMVGHLNYDVWRHPVGYLVDDLRIKRDFPSRPESRQTIDAPQTSFNAKDKDSLRNKYGHKIYGYLLPTVSGPYRLRLELTDVTAACSGELWLSIGPSPLSARLIASASTPMLGRTQHKGPTKDVHDTDEIQFEADSVYYFEFLEKAFDGKCVSAVRWKEPGAAEFSAIPSDHFAMAVNLVGSEYEDGWPVVEELERDLPSNHLQSHSRVQYTGDTIHQIASLDVLESCQFQSKIAFPHTLNKQYEGVYTVRESQVFPPDPTVFQHWRKQDKGNRFMTQERSEQILQLYKKLFTEKGYRGDVKINKMEETDNKGVGSRFLLELDIQLDGESEVLYTSEYVYLASGGDTLCHTSNFQWRRNVDVYIVVSVKNLGVWVQHLIHNMEHIYKETGDENFELVVVDYQSADLDIEAELRASSLPRWKVISRIGGFSRSGGLQAGINYVTDPDSIVMTVDMHLTLPPGFVEYTRRHVVQGKMGFAPMFFRLNPGYTEININGFWETLTYGLLGMYKSDWTTTGGFDIQKYTTKWGGEDWGAVDRVVTNGIELFRTRYPGLAHYFHTRTGMWDQTKH